MTAVGQEATAGQEVLANQIARLDGDIAAIEEYLKGYDAMVANLEESKRNREALHVALELLRGAGA